jgi:hypothetical protein
MSLPEDPASFLKQLEIPAYLIGRSDPSNHSFLYIPEIGCSDVAIK